MQHETIAWTQLTSQPLIMLKLNFSKAYDSVSWTFLFCVMTQMNIPHTFVQMVQMLLMDASAAVAINGLCTEEFSIRKGVRQGCPLAPYLLLKEAETLATASKHAMDTGRLQGIILPDGATQQVLSQFANDATYSITGTPRYLAEVSNLLFDFGHATGLTINRAKCALYWYGQGVPSCWLGDFGCAIAPPVLFPNCWALRLKSRWRQMMWTNFWKEKLPRNLATEPLSICL